MSDEQEYATGGQVGPPDGKSGVQLGDGYCWFFSPDDPASKRIKVHGGELIIRRNTAAQLPELKPADEQD